MKTILLSTFLIVATYGSLQAQTNAQDWTMSDCSSNSHTLFNYLDNEEVVIMEFAMGCGSCTYAAGYILDIRDQFNAIYPGKVNAFYMDYWSGHTCSNVNAVVPSYPFDAGFVGSGCLTEKNYYVSGSPMPAIVIVAGSNHLVIYEKNNFAAGDTTNIYNAIDNFFNTVGINKVEKNKNSAVLFPNPSNGQVNISVDWSQSENAAITVYDYTGREVMSANNYALVAGEQQFALNLSGLSNGNYIVKIQSQNEVLNLSLTINQ